MDFEINEPQSKTFRAQLKAPKQSEKPVKVSPKEVKTIEPPATMEETSLEHNAPIVAVN